MATGPLMGTNSKKPVVVDGNAIPNCNITNPIG